MIEVLKPGIETTIQDDGRHGYYDISLPPSGAMDMFSYKVGNLLLGNAEDVPSLEITYMGPELLFHESTMIAVTGGEMQPKINGLPIPLWESVEVASGDKLTFDFIKSGARVYLAVPSGFDVPIVMSSFSTYSPCSFGGFEGRKLQAGDILKINKRDSSALKAGVRIPTEYIPSFPKEHEIRFLFGLCSYRFTQESKKQFLEINWIIKSEANRVGYRLKGERLEFVSREQPFGAGSNPSNIVDSGYPIGSIQIPDGVEPIVLMSDAVTCGGFVTIGTVISADLNLLAQAKTNEKVKFVSVSLNDALEARKSLITKIEKIKDLLSR